MESLKFVKKSIGRKALNKMKSLPVVFTIFIFASGFNACQSKSKSGKDLAVETSPPSAFVFAPYDWQAPASAPILTPPIHAVSAQAPETISEFSAIDVPGHNIYPAVSPDGNKVAYTSFSRDQHGHQEIYEYDLSKKAEKRISYQKGHAFGASYHPHRPQILYASSSEELSEQPELFLPRLKAGLEAPTFEESKIRTPLQLLLLPTELILRDTGNMNRQRVTLNHGYDGEASFFDSGRRLIFSSVRKEEVHIFTMNLNGQQIQKISHLKGFNGGAHVSPEGKSVVWVNVEPPGVETRAETRVVFSPLNGKSPQILSLPQGIHLWPRWVMGVDPGEEWIVFSSNMQNHLRFSLYAITRTGGCLTRLTSDDTHEIHPITDPTGKKIFYSRFHQGRWVLGWRAFSLAKTCATLAQHDHSR